MAQKAQVDIEPAAVEFKDVEVGKTLKRKVQVINCGKVGKEIRFINQPSDHFSYEYKNSDEPVAPGLCAVAIVKYRVYTEEQRSDQLLVTVDGCAIPIPITA